MKKVISIVLSAAMVASMLTGFGFIAYAADVVSIEYNRASDSPYPIYEHNWTYTEHDDAANEDFECYDIDFWYCLEEGNTLNVNYSDSTRKTFECKRVYWGENEGDYDLRYMCGNEELDEDNISVDSHQSFTNQFTLGNEYDVDVIYRGKSDSFKMKVVENPIDDVQVDLEKPLTLYENYIGNKLKDEGGTWFRYNEEMNYLNYMNPTITVTYKQGGTKVYTYKDLSDFPSDENGEYIDGTFFNFHFDQWYTHFAKGSASNHYYVKFYSVGQDFNANVVDLPDTIDEGVLTVSKNDENKSKLLFVEYEDHTLTFTPEDDGLYFFEGSLSDRYRDGEYDWALKENGNKVEPTDERELSYLLEKGKTYTVVASKKYDDGHLRLEDLLVRRTEAVADFEFTPVNPNTLDVYAGNPCSENELYKEGNKINVTFTNGDTDVFTANEYWEYKNEHGEKIEDFARVLGVDFDCRPRCEFEQYEWEEGKANNYTIVVGNCRKNYAVNLLASPYKSVEYVSRDGVSVFDGTARTEREWDEEENRDVDYLRFDLNEWNIGKEGNSIVVTYDNYSTETFEFQWVPLDNGDGYDAYVSTTDPNNKITPDDLLVRDNQGHKSQWTVGNTYNADVYVKGAKATVPVTVLPNPVSSISVTTDGTITLFENCNGNWQDDNGDNFFEYWSDRNYLRRQSAAITVNYVEGGSKTYRFYDYNWVPETEDHETLDEEFFDFNFGDQWDNHLTPGNAHATVSYFGKEAVLPVNIIPADDVDEGELKVNELKKILFLGNEEHIFSFTPDKTSTYDFGQSIIDRIEKNECELNVYKGHKKIDPYEGEQFIFALEANTEYTVSLSWKNGDTPAYECIDIAQCTLVSDVEFTPANQLTVNEGDFYDERLLYSEGNKLKVFLSDGTSEEFTAVDGGWRYVNDRGEEIENFLHNAGVHRNAHPHAWENGEWSVTANPNPHIIIEVADAQTTCPVTIIASAVESITYHQAEPLELADKLVWSWYNEDEHRTECEIVDRIFREGDTLTVVYNDGRGTVTYQNINPDEFANVNDPNDVIRPNIRYDMGKEYNIGDTVDFTVRFFDKSYDFTGVVVTCDVESFDYHPVEPFEYLKESGGHWETKDDGNGNTDKFYVYDEQNIFRPGSFARVKYKSTGRTITYTCNSEGDFVSSDGAYLDLYYLNALWGRDQYDSHWYPNKNNYIKVSYMAVECPVPVTIVDRADWEKTITVKVNGAEFTGDTVYIEKGQTLFFSFETDDRNMDHGVTPFAGFSDGYSKGTLTTAGFAAESGNANAMGLDQYGDTMGLKVETGNLEPGAEGTLNFFLYQLPVPFDMANFDFVNTPHVYDKSLKVVVTDHRYIVSKVINAPTCTENGWGVYTCTVCGDAHEGTIDALGHEFSPWAAVSAKVEPTCTKDGKTAVATRTCTRCGKTETNGGAKINALGHKFGNNSKTCSVCGAANPNYKAPAVPAKDIVDLSLKKVKVKKSAKKVVIQATLKVNGKAVKGKKVTFKFNGKKYAAKTNKKGVAKITVKKNVLKKLKVGKKVKYQATYGNTTVSKSVKVKK